MLLLILAFSALAVASAETVDAEAFSQAEAQSARGPYDNAMFNKYVESLFGLSDGQFRLRGGTKNLTGVNKIVYDRLVPMIQKVASGSATSTAFTVSLSLSELGLKKADWTAQELGVSALVVNGKVDSDSVNPAACKLVGLDPGLIIETLMYNYPYEMYWYDKDPFDHTSPYTYGLGSVRSSSSGYYFSFDNCEVRLSLRVAQEFAADAGDGKIYNFITKSGMATAAVNAASRARSIVNKYASTATNYEKLDGYRKEICNLVSYNDAAWNNGQPQRPYGNPWQLVWVFDGDSKTDVVCEGYAKAFQYLCDQTVFQGDVSCISVSGQMNDGSGFEGHMWNLVRMPDGKSYLADITVCDSLSFKSLFMVGYSSKPSSSRYVFNTSSKSFTYQYHDYMFNLYPSSRLEISNTSFNTNPSGVRISADQFPDTAFRAYISRLFDSDGNGALSSAEIASVRAIGVSYMNIASLKGIEYFTALEALDCSGNTLRELDVSHNTELYSLECADNRLATLNVRSNTLLEKLDCSENSIVSLDISCCPTLVKNRRSTSYLKCDPEVVLYTGIASQGIPINATNFPDAAFRAYIAKWFDEDADDGLSESEIEWVTDISVSSLGITSLKGIELFPQLEYLWCEYNELTSLDISRNTALKYLDCSGNALTTLNVSSCRGLQTLYCSENQLDALNLYYNTALERLRCYGNRLTTLNLSRNPLLTDLRCDQNRLTSLDLTQNPALTALECSYNQLANLDVRLNTALTALRCSNNSLAALDVSCNEALSEFDCQKNQITALDVTHNAALKILYCRNNPLTALDISQCPILVENRDNRYNLDVDSGIDLIIARPEVEISADTFPDDGFRAYVSEQFDLDASGSLSQGEIAAAVRIDVDDQEFATLTGVEYFTALEELHCGSNQLTVLDVTQNTALKELDCSFNQLSGLDVRNNPALVKLYCIGNQLLSLDVSRNPALELLSCGENRLDALDITRNTALGSLICDKNRLSSLDVSKNIALKTLYCTENLLTELDVSHNAALKTLMCGKNKLSKLDVSHNSGLTQLAFYENQIRRMDVSSCPEVLNDSITQLFLTYTTHVHIITGAEASYTVLTLPEGLTEIEEEAFSGIGADAVEIPAGCASIAANAFVDCPKLKEVRFPASAAPEIDPSAFNGKVTLVTDSPAVQAWAQAHKVKWVYDLG